ncbi:hypothetical protein LEMLEM_LOCUS1054, partial [Lemmus lemmus]
YKQIYFWALERGRREQGAGNATQGCQDQGCPPSLQQVHMSAPVSTCRGQKRELVSSGVTEGSELPSGC